MCEKLKPGWMAGMRVFPSFKFAYEVFLDFVTRLRKKQSWTKDITQTNPPGILRCGEKSDFADP